MSKQQGQCTDSDEWRSTPSHKRKGKYEVWRKPIRESWLFQFLSLDKKPKEREWAFYRSYATLDIAEKVVAKMKRECMADSYEIEIRISDSKGE